MKETKIKICGFKDAGTIIKAEKLGADYLGVVIDFPQVPQSITAEEAVKLTAVLQEEQPDILNSLVGVFVDKPIMDLITLIKESNLSVVQLHGNESPDYCSQVRSQAVVVLKAFRVKSVVGKQGLVDQIRPYESSIDGILLDAYSPEREGGALGEKFDWDLARAVRDSFPDIPLTLAGGLTSTNVQQAITLVAPQIVDVSSGVDRAPGVKDLERIGLFINAVSEIYD